MSSLGVLGPMGFGLFSLQSSVHLGPEWLKSCWEWSGRTLLSPRPHMESYEGGRMAPSAALADLKLGSLTGFARARSSPAAENDCFSPISSPNSPFFCALHSPLSRHCGRLPNDQLSFGVASGRLMS